ncbi:MAG: EF-hand domain-containing protein [Gammaproteobacteria bacterium]|nr:EF-hand domain-containing protein [Gammaproteobacteria bacterium]MCP5137407.1 EF-hand domain-containing protein [Gammaproteobacteria bacterium]
MKSRYLSIAILLLSTTALAQPSQGMPDIGAMFLRQFDADNDGKVTRDEFIKPSEAQFERMDSNHDGAVDASELEALKVEMMQRMQQRTSHQ